LSGTACENYLKIIDAYLQKLTHLRDQAAALTSYGEPGGFPSAKTAVFQLQDAVTNQGRGIKASLDAQIRYVTEFKSTVKASLTRFQAEENS
jgi:hypothetical protein